MQADISVLITRPSFQDTAYDDAGNNEKAYLSTSGMKLFQYFNFDNIISCINTQIRPTAQAIGLIIHFSIVLFFVYTEFGIDSGSLFIGVRK